MSNKQTEPKLSHTEKMQEVIDTIEKDYPDGYFSGEFDGDYECKGFARKVYYLYFEKYQSNAEYYWTANSVVNAQADNSLITTAENMSTLIPNLPICTLMRVVTQSGVFHSIIISARNSAQVEVYDANRYGGYNKINRVTMDYATFSKTFPKIIYFSQGNVYNSSLTGTCYFPLQQGSFISIGSNNTIDFQLTVNQTA